MDIEVEPSGILQKTKLVAEPRLTDFTDYNLDIRRKRTYNP